MTRISVLCYLLGAEQPFLLSIKPEEDDSQRVADLINRFIPLAKRYDSDIEQCSDETMIRHSTESMGLSISGKAVVKHMGVGAVSHLMPRIRETWKHIQ